MPRPIATVTKLNRAAFHLSDFQEECRAFLTPDAFDFNFERSAQADEFLLWARAKRPFPAEMFGVIVGDIAHNARSALDLLVQSLCQLPMGDKGRHQLAFPICDNLEKFNDQLRRHVLDGVPNNFRALIEAAQPFQSGGNTVNSSLRLLRELNNLDKHRIIPVIQCITKVTSLGSKTGIFGDLEFTPDTEMSFARGGIEVTYSGTSGAVSEEGAVVGRISAKPFVRFSIDCQSQSSIHFGKDTPELEERGIVESLGSMILALRTLVERFM